MPIDKFARITGYFAHRDSVSANDLDDQFNDIIDYLNQKVVPILNALTNETVPGSDNPIDAGKFRKNIGDTTTEWSFFGNDSIQEQSLALVKIAKANQGSVLIGDANQRPRAIAPNEANQVLLANGVGVPTWSKLTGDNLENRTLGANHILAGSITAINVAQNVLDTQLLNDTVTNIKLDTHTLATRHLQDAFATQVKFQADTLQRFIEGSTPDVWLPDNFVYTINMNDGAIHKNSFAAGNINLDARVLQGGGFTFADIAEGMIVNQFIDDGAIGINVQSEQNYYGKGIYYFIPTTFIDWSTFPPGDPNQWIMDDLINEYFLPWKVRNKVKAM